MSTQANLEQYISPKRFPLFCHLIQLWVPCVLCVLGHDLQLSSQFQPVRSYCQISGKVSAVSDLNWAIVGQFPRWDLVINAQWITFEKTGGWKHANTKEHHLSRRDGLDLLISHQQTAHEARPNAIDSIVEKQSNSNAITRWSEINSEIPANKYCGWASCTVSSTWIHLFKYSPSKLANCTEAWFGDWGWYGSNL